MAEIKDVTDPRFEKHISRKLEKLFIKTDINKTGTLTYNEFIAAVDSINYKLDSWDMQLILAIIDKNNNRVIHYRDFHALIIDLILNFLLRNKAVGTEQELKIVPKESLRLIYSDEINQTTQVLGKKFKAIDPESKGFIPKEELRKILTQEKHTSIKERNLLLNICTKDDMYEYKNFARDILEVRYQVIISGVLESYMDKVEEEMFELFKKKDVKGNGLLTPQQIKEVLLETNYSNLTPLQIYSTIGVFNPKGENRMDYKSFAAHTKTTIQQYYGLEAIRKKLEMHTLGKLNMEEMKKSQEYDAFEMFGLFRKYDINRNDYLELSEYVKCLKDSGIKLSDPELVTLGLFADTSGNNKIDYEEFNKHFPSLLKIVKMHKILNDSIKPPEKEPEEEAE
jgi:Ca2+-binding EF-hand superfamily protein